MNFHDLRYVFITKKKKPAKQLIPWHDVTLKIVLIYLQISCCFQESLLTIKANLSKKSTLFETEEVKTTICHFVHVYIFGGPQTGQAKIKVQTFFCKKNETGKKATNH